MKGCDALTWWKTFCISPIILCCFIFFVQIVYAEETRYSCTYYSETRYAEPQYNLPNCSWYKDLACCRRTEVTSVLGSMYMIHSGTKACKARLNYMMCYFCSPAQATFYDRGRVNVCSSFCNDTFEECKTTKLENLTIGSMYKNGEEFCRANSFEIIPGNDHCFDFDPSVFEAASGVSCNVYLVLFLSVFTFLYCTVQQSFFRD